MSTEFHEDCAVAGVYGYKKAARATRDLLLALQHRGQESSGIISFNGIFHPVKGMGWVDSVFTKDRLEELVGDSAVGHNRYSTVGASDLLAAQPHLVPCGKASPVAFASNGDIPDYWRLRREFEPKIRRHFDLHGPILKTRNDGEFSAHLLSYFLDCHHGNIVEAVKEFMNKVRGAYSAVVLWQDQLIAFRDPWGIRPLVLGKRGKSWLIASETCAIDTVLGRFLREIAPGELVIINRDGLTSVQIGSSEIKPAHCIFELIYFSRPDSEVFGLSCSAFRRILGRRNFERYPTSADIVIAVPDSSNQAAAGYARASGIPFDFGLIRSHYAGRTFIEPSQAVRNEKVRLKFNPDRGVLNRARVIVIDDSIVRSTTSRKVVRMIQGRGKRPRTHEIHLRIISPPVRFPCPHLGINTPTRKELAAAYQSVEKIRRTIKVDTLAYNHPEDLKTAVAELGGNPEHFCDGCFTGSYPLEELNTKFTRFVPSEKSFAAL